MAVGFQAQGSGHTEEERAERMEEPQDGKDCCEVLPSGYGRAVALLNSQQRWLPAQDESRQNASLIKESSRGPTPS